MNQKSKKLKIIIGILALVLVVLIVVAVVIAQRESDVPRVNGVPVKTEPIETADQAAEPTNIPTESTTPPAQTVPETEPMVYEGTPVETPCGTIILPNDWDLEIQVETVSENPVVLDFLAGGEKLYSLTFSDHADGAFGQVSVNGELVYISIEIYELDGADDQMLSMQESINEILEQLDAEPVTQIPEQTEPVIEDIVISTAYGDLLFPGKWEDNLQVKQPDDHTVEFYGGVANHDPVLLFSLHFESEDGDITLEMVKEDHSVVAVAIDIEEIQFDSSWKDEEENLIYSMQEDLNYIIESLQG